MLVGSSPRPTPEALIKVACRAAAVRSQVMYGCEETRILRQRLGDADGRVTASLELGQLHGAHLSKAIGSCR